MRARFFCVLCMGSLCAVVSVARADSALVIDPDNSGYGFAYGGDNKTANFYMKDVFLPPLDPANNDGTATTGAGTVTSAESVTLSPTLYTTSGSASVTWSGEQPEGLLDAYYTASAEFNLVFSATAPTSVWLRIDDLTNSYGFLSGDTLPETDFTSTQGWTKYDLGVDTYYLTFHAEAGGVYGDPDQFGSYSAQLSFVDPVPEPISMVMLGGLGLGMAAARRLRRESA